MQSLKIASTLILSAFLIGCAALQGPYIKADRPYERKIIGEYDLIATVTRTIIEKEGWVILEEVDPALYERRQEGESSSKDVLIITQPRSFFKMFYWVSAHLNVFVLKTADGALIDVRYESTGLIKRSVKRNDKLVNKLLDRIEDNIANE